MGLKIEATQPNKAGITLTFGEPKAHHTSSAQISSKIAAAIENHRHNNGTTQNISTTSTSAIIFPKAAHFYQQQGTYKAKYLITIFQAPFSFSQPLFTKGTKILGNI